MKKRFKAKRRRIIRIKVLLFIIIMVISFYFVFNYLYNKTSSSITKDQVINYLILDNNKNYSNLFKLNKNELLLKYSLGIDISNFKKDGNNSPNGDYIEDPNKNNQRLDNPIIYIYNTHQSEGYNKDLLSTYNIIPTVMLDSYMLREALNNLGLPTIVETTNIKTVLDNNNWTYKDSYKASRLLLEEAYRNNPSLKMFIDIHRDSSAYNNTTFNENGYNYAKVLFVVGLEYNNYQDNLNKAYQLNEYIRKENNNLSRGVLEKSGPNVNGIYNQDFHSNTFLIEIGGQYNSIDDVKNSMSLIAKAIYGYVKDNEI